MRFLFCTRPFYGHFHVMAGVARAAQEAGHDVAFATAANFREVVEQNRFAHLAAGLDPRDLPTTSPGGLPEDRDWGQAVIRSKLSDLLALVPSWRPDVVVRDQTDLAALIAAEVAGLPAATLGPAMFIPPRSWQRLVGDGLDQIWRDVGLPPDPTWERSHAYLYLDPVPAWYQLPAANDLPVRHLIRPGLFDGAEASARPGWIEELPERPTIYVTLGTVFNRRPELLGTILAALGALTINVICTVGPDQDWGRIPEPTRAHIRVERFIPQSQLLPHCHVVVSHGGFSTVMGALAHGLPLLIIPLGSDNPVHARRCVSLGLGQSIAPSAVTEHGVRQAVSRLMTERRWRREAERRQEEIARLPSLQRGVDLLVRLALTRQPIWGEG